MRGEPRCGARARAEEAVRLGVRGREPAGWTPVQGAPNKGVECVALNVDDVLSSMRTFSEGSHQGRLGASNRGVVQQCRGGHVTIDPPIGMRCLGDHTCRRWTNEIGDDAELLRLIIAHEQRASGCELGEYASETPHVDGMTVLNP